LFDHCIKIERICAFATEEKDFSYCGLATTENRIELMSKCPKKQNKRWGRK
tara:strand:- start:279 stop:431 length:153 start_codon:yes stop_codon:yes gene_type:complete